MTNTQPTEASDGWIAKASPDGLQRVRVRAQDHRGFYIIPFPAEFKSGKWFNGETGEELDCHVAGWMAWENAEISP
jgi:hypothetical protein